MINQDKVTEIFCLVDEFCHQFQNFTRHHTIGKPSKRPPIMSQSEVITIMILFHMSEWGLNVSSIFTLIIFKSICSVSFQKLFLITVLRNCNKKVFYPWPCF